MEESIQVDTLADATAKLLIKALSFLTDEERMEQLENMSEEDMEEAFLAAIYDVEKDLPDDEKVCFGAFVGTLMSNKDLLSCLDNL